MRRRPKKYPILNNLVGLADLDRYPVVAEIITSRNISNVEEVEKYINKFHVDSDKVNDWLDTTLRKFLINKYEQVEPYFPKASDPEWMQGKDDVKTVVLDDALSQKIEHVIHFLEDKLLTDPSFGFKSLQAEQAFKQADEWTKRLQKKKAKKEGEGTDYNILKEFGDGFFWAELISRNATMAEGQKMGHCVGGESYWRGIQDGRIKIISLRDPNGDPHATIEYDIGSKTIKQIKGKGNRGVVAKYIDHVLDFISNPPFPIRSIYETDVRLNGLIKSKGGYLSLIKLPDGAHLEGDFDLSSKFQGESFNLPANLTVEGNLTLSNTATLKPNTTVTETLKLAENTSSLPSGLKVGSLTMFRSKLSNLPEDIQIEFNLNAEFSDLNSIPPLKIKGDLTISDTPIKSLPEGLDVGGELDIMNTQIQVLPESLKVGKAIFVDDVEGMSIPESLKKLVL